MYGQKYGRREKNRNGQKRSPKPDNARRLRGIYSIDPDDEEHKETFKHARRKLERPKAVVVPCKRKAPHRITEVFAKSETASEKTPKTIYGSSGCKSCRGQGMEKARDNPSVAIGKLRARRRPFSKHKETKRKSTLEQSCHLQNAKLEPKFQKYRGGAVFRREIVKGDS